MLIQGHCVKNAVAFVRCFKNIVFPLRKNKIVLSYGHADEKLDCVMPDML